MKLKQSVCLAFMLFPTLSFANNEFNSVIEDFDRYFETQEPIKIEPKTSAITSSSTRTGQANRRVNLTTTATQQTKPERQVKPSTPAKTDNQTVEPIKTPDITLAENCLVLPTNYSKLESDYTRYLTPLLSFVPIKPQFTPEDLNRYSYRNNATVYNPLALYSKESYTKPQRNDNFLLDIIPGTFYSVTAIPFHFAYQFNRSVLDHKQPLFNKELLNRLADTRNKYQSLYQKYTEQAAITKEHLEKLQNANNQIKQLELTLAETEEKLAIANNLLTDDTLKQAVAKLQSDLETIQKERDLLVKQLSEKENVLQATTVKNTELAKQQQNFENQAGILKTLEAKYTQLEQEKEQLQSQYQQAQTLLKDDSAKKEIDKLQRSLESIKLEQEKLISQLNEKQILLAKIEQEKETIQAQYVESQQLLVGNNKQKEQELANLEAVKNKEIATLENSLSTITTEQEKLTKQLTDVQNQLAIIKKEKEDVQTQFTQAQLLLKDDSAKKEIDKLQSTLLKITSEREDLSKELALKVAEAEKQQDANSKLVEEQRKEIAQLKIQVEKSNQEQTQLNKSLLAVQQQKEQVDEKLKAIPELKSQLDNKVTELADLKKSLSAGEKAVDNLIADKNNLIAKLEKAQTELSEKYQTLDTQFKENNIVLAQVTTSKTESEKALALLEKQLAEKQNTTDKLSAQLAEAKVQLEKQNTENTQKISTLKQQQTESIAKLNEQIKAKDAELAKVNTDTNNILKENKTLKEQLEKMAGEGQMIAGQLAYAYSIIGKDNAQRNKSILSEIQKQNYVQYDDNTYFKILKQGKPVASITGKTVVFTMHESLTDGTVTLNYDKSKPLILPYRQLPLPLNTFIAKAGINGKAKIYIKPSGGYGKNGVPGQVPPESMSIVTIEILDIK
ncbi:MULTISPECIES: sugar transporter [Proteus]|uniref:sugar transporter n=1 Tax=Proteus TaxID=583 RepID=UPI001377C867|nr:MULTISPECIES: sugar transporter [Proteus]MCX2588744.1 sugar transporter [Proteus penneri]NBL79038.1 sugar transporter [Proteus sp. G2672]NBL91183.1 sugar transporter [Proteus sp. G2673]NBM04161.1 sugar transporter [Proteus sp. G2671]NBM49814.1 sugar transporter [Proteus sp. G2666]